MRPTIIVFAKAPVPGRVKTRLGLAPEQASRLHERFVRATVELVTGLDADVELHTDIATEAWRDLPVRRRLQESGDLGARMYAVMFGASWESRASSMRSCHVMIVGSDAPTVPKAHLVKLLDSTADIALGPAEDGGYYAIACRRLHPAMFRGVEWSTRETLNQTIEAARACGLTVELGEPWFDVDRPEDLARAGEV